MAKKKQTRKKENPIEKIFTNKIPIKTEAEFLGYRGSTPFVEFDENWQQMSLDRTKLSIPREHLTRMFPLAYLAGKLAAFEEGAKIGFVSILILAMIVVSIGVIYYKTELNYNEIKQGRTDDSTNYETLSNEIAAIQVTQGLIAEKLNVETNYSIPTVGG